MTTATVQSAQIMKPETDAAVSLPQAAPARAVDPGNAAKSRALARGPMPITTGDVQHQQAGVGNAAAKSARALVGAAPDAQAAASPREAAVAPPEKRYNLQLE